MFGIGFAPRRLNTRFLQIRPGIRTEGQGDTKMARNKRLTCQDLIEPCLAALVQTWEEYPRIRPGRVSLTHRRCTRHSSQSRIINCATKVYLCRGWDKMFYAIGLYRIFLSQRLGDLLKGHRFLLRKFDLDTPQQPLPN